MKDTAEDSFQCINELPFILDTHRVSQCIPVTNRLMNEFVDEHGSITDDEYFRVL
jgi:hypothetical protein